MFLMSLADLEGELTLPRRYFYKTLSLEEIANARWRLIRTCWLILFVILAVSIVRWSEPPVFKFPAPPQPMFVTSAPPQGWLIRCMSIDPERKVIRPFWEDSACIREAQQLEQAAIRMREEEKRRLVPNDR
jgi:hypothetical protein